MRKILILLLVCSGVYAQDVQNIDGDTAKVAKTGYNRISIRGAKMFFRGATGTKKEIVSTNNSYANPSWIPSLALAKITGLPDSLSNTVKKVTGKGLSANDFTDVLKTKLDGISTGATANSSDATLLARANHTGTQLSSTISNFSSSVISSIPQAIDNTANPLFKGLDLRKQTTISTPSLGIRLGNIGGNLAVKDSLGVTKTVAYTSDYIPLSGTSSLVGSIIPTTNNSYDIGSNSFMLRYGYFQNVTVNNALNLTDLYANNSAGLVFRNNGATKYMQLFNSTGNLVLQNGGTFTDAGYKLDVNGTARFSDNITLGNDKWIGNNSITKIIFGGGNAAIGAVVSVKLAGGGLDPFGANLFVVTGASVGVGIGTPTSKFHNTGSQAASYVSTSTNLALGEHRFIVVISTATISLPTASTCFGRFYTINARSTGVTISSYTNLAGTTGITTITNGTSITLISDGNTWQQVQ